MLPMARRGAAVHVVTTRRVYKGKLYQTHLLRRSYREGAAVRNETLANLSHLPDPLVDLIRRGLRGEQLCSVQERFEVIASRHHGHVDAVLTTMRRLGVERLIASRPWRERDLVLAMIAARILAPTSKLATTRWWSTTTLPALLGVEESTEDDCYEAMDWLLTRQGRIEKKLAARHLQEGGLVLYDLTSSYFEGRTCPLAARGHDRDGKRGKLQVNYGLLTTALGIPVSVSVFKGNTADPSTLLGQVQKVREKFGVRHLALVGDRGMISQKQIDALRGIDGMQWITALRSEAIGELIEQGHVQLGLFDQRNLFELTHPDYPGERLVACRNPELAKSRGHTRESLLAATVRELDIVCGMVKRGRLKGQDAIGVRVGKVINKYKVAKHFVLEIGATAFSYRIDEEHVQREAALDGIYIIRTSLAPHTMSAEDAVRSYKQLSTVERAFRCYKTIDLKVRPIHHHVEARVRVHIFLCLLAYYVEWHMIAAWRPLLFCDEDQQAKKTRDPVAPATRSEKALDKVHSRRLDDGSVVHSFRTLLGELTTIVRNTCRAPGTQANAATFDMITRPNAKQARAAELLQSITV
jgi:transposase